MSDIRLPVVNAAGDTEIITVDRDTLSLEDRENADSYLDTLDYFLDASSHPNRTTNHTLSDFEESYIEVNGENYYLQTDGDWLEEAAEQDDINPAEDHSL